MIFIKLVEFSFFFGISVSLKCKSDVYGKALTLQEQQIPPRFSTYLVINKRITALIL